MQLHRSAQPKVDVMPNNIITFQMFTDRSNTAVIFIKDSTRPRRTRILNTALCFDLLNNVSTFVR